MKGFECPKSIIYNEKKILGVSDTWLMSRLSHLGQANQRIIL